MAAGFVHGVLNSDNINVTGESFDYGPWRFTPMFEPGFTAAYFDHQGLYAFARQAEAIQWDLVQLVVALNQVAQSEALAPLVIGFGVEYRRALVAKLLWRLGVKPRGEPEDIALVQSIEKALVESKVGIDRFFFDWRGGRMRRRSDCRHAGLDIGARLRQLPRGARGLRERRAARPPLLVRR